VELTCTSFSFPLLSLEDSIRVIRIIDVPYVDLGAYVGWSHLQPDDIEERPGQVVERLKRIQGETGIGFADLFPSFGAGFRDRPLNTPDLAQQAANRKRFRAFVDLCRACDIKGITILPGVIWEDLGFERSFDLSVAAFREFVAMTADAGIRLSTEPHLESVVEDLDAAVRLVEALPGLGFTLDYSHFVAAYVPVERIHPLIPYTKHFHARQCAPGMLQASREEGTLDFPDIVRRLKAVNYQGFLSLEYVWQEWRGCNRVDVLSESILLRDELRTAMRES